MGDDTKKPGDTNAGGDKPGQPEAAKRPGEKDGKWGASGEGNQSAATPSHERKAGIGNRQETQEDRDNAKKPKTASEVGVKPLYSKTLYDNTLEKGHGNKENDDDQSYYSTLTAKVSVEALGATVDVKEKKAKLLVVNAKAEGSVAHGQFDVGTFLHDLLFGKTPEPAPIPPNPPSPPAPMAARVGDMTTHGTPLAPGTGSPNVMIGGMPAWRVGPDLHICPFPGPPHGTGPTLIGAPTVLINGFPAARAGDFVVEPVGGPNVILLGCPTVFIGPTAKPAPPATPVEPRPEDLPFVLFESVVSGDMVAGEANAKVEGEANLKEGKGKVEAIVGGEAAVLKGEIPLKLRIRIPYTTYYVGLGVTGKGTLLAVGAEAGAGVKINDGKKLFEATAGASASIGPGGLGAKFSLDVAKK